MKDRDDARLNHIYDAICDIEHFIEGADYDAFMKNRMMSNAVLKSLEVIGEAANHVSEEFKRAHPEIPFSDIIGSRNYLIHEYFGIDYGSVWETCKNDLPVLKRQLYDILQ